ncbi:hypothetical protein [Joostella sp. CR20]|uniref:hypothetical protein n=1 Tax=Joostella sp. CR20 TaxID=2804312 RepID=UPI00313AC7BB
MTKLFLAFLLGAVFFFQAKAQSYSGVLTHTQSYFIVKPYDSSYDDGYDARIFYDGNKKALRFWNSDPNISYTNIEIGSLVTHNQAIINNGKQRIYLASGENSSSYILSVGVNDDGVNFENNSIIRGFNFKNNRGLLMKISDKGNALLNGKFEAKEIKVTTTPTADFVFEDNYKIPSLEEVEDFIKKNKHLPEVASAEEMKKNGVNVGAFQIKLLQKIEELTIHTINQEKRIDTLEEKNEKLIKVVERLLMNKESE